MKKLHTEAHLTTQELKEILNSQKEVRAFKDWLIIYAVQNNPGISAIELSNILGISKSKIYFVIQNYNKFGKNWRVYGKWGGRRNERCYLTLEEEKNVLLKIYDSSEQCKCLTYRQIKGKIEEYLSKKVSDGYVWDLLKRHKWKKKKSCQKNNISQCANSSVSYWVPQLTE